MLHTKVNRKIILSIPIVVLLVWGLLGVSSVAGSPEVLVVDPDSPPIYWTDWGVDKIQRANLDGSNVEDLVTTGLRVPWGIALDIAGGKMYWTDFNKIQRANLDGSNVEDLVTSGLSYSN